LFSGGGRLPPAPNLTLRRRASEKASPAVINRPNPHPIPAEGRFERSTSSFARLMPMPYRRRECRTRRRLPDFSRPGGGWDIRIIPAQPSRGASASGNRSLARIAKMKIDPDDFRVRPARSSAQEMADARGSPITRPTSNTASASRARRAAELAARPALRVRPPRALVIFQAMDAGRQGRRSSNT